MPVPWLQDHTSPELELAMSVLHNGVQPILIVRALGILARESERLLHIAVTDCRADGCSWSEVGDALGVSRQAARRRFME